MRTLTLLSLLFITIYGQGQEQVSNVYFDELQYPVAVDKICGFHTYNGVDYVTLENDSLQIFELINDELNLKHTIHKSKEFDLKAFGNVFYNNSQKNIEGKYYYSFYQNGIFIVDIEDGSIFRSLDFSENGYRLFKVIKKTEGQIYFHGIYEESKPAYFRYEISSNQLFLLDTPIEPDYYVRLIGHTIFYNDDSMSRIMGYDLLMDSTFIAHEYVGELVSNLSWRDNLGQEFLVFRDEMGFKIIQNDLEVTELNCNFENLEDVDILELKGNKAVLGVKEMGRVGIHVYNIDNCDLLQEFNVDNDENAVVSNFSNNGNLVEDYSIYSYNNSFWGDMRIVIDHTTKTHSITFSSGYVVPHAVAETTNAVYWNEHATGYYGQRVELMRYDKLNRTISLASPYESRITLSSLGLSKGDDIYFAANDSDNNYKIWKTFDGDQFSEIKDLDFKYNLGVDTRYDIRVDDKSVVSNGAAGIMITKDDTEIVSPGTKNQKLAITDNYIATVTTEGENNYLLKYDKQSGVSSKIFLNQTEENQFKPIVTDKFIFDTDENVQRYYDIENEEFKALNHNNPSINIVPTNYYASTDKMVIKEWVNSMDPQNYYFFDFETEILKRVEGELPRSFLWAGTDKNTFYFENRNVFLVNEEITRLKDGAVPEIVYAGDCEAMNLAVQPKLQTGDYAELFFRCEGEMLIVTDNGTTTHSTLFPTDASLFSSNIANIILHTNEDEYILKSEIEEQVKYFLFRSPNTLIELNIPEEESFRSTSFDNENPLIITYNEDEKIYSFYFLDKLTGALDLKMESPNGSDYYKYSIFNPQAISPTKYLISVFDDNLGNELFVIDLESQTISLLQDINEGKPSSSPRDFTRTSDYLYFTALLPEDGRQWFRVKAESLTSNHEIVVESLHELNVFPNPSSQSINMRIKLERYSIYNVQGQEVLSNSSNDSELIRINQLADGQYIIIGVDGRGFQYSGRFVKVE